MSIFSRKPKISPSLPDEVIKKYFETFPDQKYTCNAANNALYFNQSGLVAACCASNNYYGKYPQQSFKEILNSKERKLQQKYIKENNLSLGCKSCEKSLLSGDFYGAINAGYLHLKLLKKDVEHIFFDLSSVCNLDCIMCTKHSYINNSIYDVDKLIQDLKPYIKKIKFINFLGGEPFFIKDYYKIWEFVTRYNPECTISVQTNGTIYNDTIEQLMDNFKFRIVISLDSLNKEVYESIRRGANFENVMQNFQKFRDLMSKKNNNIMISVCPMTLNMYEMPELIDFANKNDSIVNFNTVVSPFKLSLKSLDIISLEDLIKKYKAYKFTSFTNFKYYNKNIQTYNSLISLLEDWHKQKITNKDNQILINKEDFISLIKLKRKEAEFNHIIQYLQDNLPNTWLMNKAKNKELQDIIVFNEKSKVAIQTTNLSEILDWILYE